MSYKSVITELASLKEKVEQDFISCPINRALKEMVELERKSLYGVSVGQINQKYDAIIKNELKNYVGDSK